MAFAAAGELDDALEAARREDLLSPGRPALEWIHMARREYREAERVARERIARSGLGQLPLANALAQYEAERERSRSWRASRIEARRSAM